MCDRPDPSEFVPGTLSGHVALVTGGQRGIGRAICLELAAHGADLAINIDPGEPAAAPDAAGLAERVRDMGRRAMVIPADVAISEQVTAMVDAVVVAWEKLSILVNNAAIVRTGPLLQMNAEAWDRVFDVNVRGVFLCCRAAAPYLMQHGGSIVNVGSTLGLVAHPGYAAYGAAKASVLNLTRSIAVEWGPLGVRANAVAPGTTRVERLSTTLLATPEALAQEVSRIPLRRVAEPEDVARVVRFLVSPDARHINGAVLTVDGGLLAQSPQPDLLEP